MLALSVRYGSCVNFVVDQSASPQLPSAYHMLFPGVGQEFKPTFSRVDFIDAMLWSAAAEFATFQMRVHEGTLAGPVIAVSSPIDYTFSGGAGMPVRFLFPASVPVVPNQTYVFEIPPMSIYTGAAVGPTPYDRGRVFQPDIETPADYDLWFREGIIVPEPATWKLIAAATLLLGMVRHAKAGGCSSEPKVARLNSEE
jgi:hypothetical protein